MSKYSEFHRIPTAIINKLKTDRLYERIDEKQAILKILEYYQLAFDKIYNETGDTRKLSDWNIDFSECVYNNHPHVLAVYISNNIVNFHLNEQFSNCGILVSSKTYLAYTNIGFGSLLQCIKEDIAYLFGYSFLSYTDIVLNHGERTNTKLILNTGAKEIFRGLNTRSGNHIAIWMKDINTYYNTRTVTELPEIIEKTEEKAETVLETKKLETTDF